MSKETNRTGSIKTKKKQAWNRLTRATTSWHKHLRTVTAGAAPTSLSYPAMPLVKFNGTTGDVIYRGHKSWWCGQNSFQAHENPTFNFLYFNPGSRVNTDKTNKDQLLKGGKVLHWPQLEAVTLRNLYQPTCKHEAYSKQVRYRVLKRWTGGGLSGATPSQGEWHYILPYLSTSRASVPLQVAGVQ